ncbi:anti-sigma factor domain-containing protein [Paenibacillaceae bacterium WGS1546]|uniref:anti-sigma factor domain-containing protein n=1 Tax=Cohnella sp. WGS1546 TaxID=3366810 RepID=UPI00372D28FF
MIGRECNVPDERWVDYHLGKLRPDASDALRRHAEGCAVCRQACLQWARWLGVEAAGTGERPDSPPSDAPDCADARLPGRKVRRSLRRRMAIRAAAMAATRRPARSAAIAVGAAMLVAVLIGLHRLPMGGPFPSALQPQAYAELHEPDGALLMSRPGTQVYSQNSSGGWSDSTAARGTGTNVTVWVNADTEELFVLLEGLTASEGNDVQLWGDAPDALTSLGLLEFHSNQGHLYSRLREVALLRALRLTIEPKGGSELPSVPESALVRLERE